MKLPITDKFLLEIYNVFDLTIGTLDEILAETSPPRSLRESIELRKLKKRYEREKAKRSFKQFINYLKKKGYIKIENLEQKQGVLLTRRGIEKALRAKLKTKEKKRRKDGKWQMVIFDIPEEKKKLRELFRGRLQLLRYKMLQQSVWVCPHDVYKETEEIIRRYSLDSYVRIFLIEEIEI